MVGRDLDGGGAQRGANCRWVSGGIAWSPSAIRNQVGSAFQAGTPITSPRALQCNGLLDREHDLGLDRVDIGREMVGHGSSRGSSLARRRSGPRAALPVAAPPVASSPSTITAGVRAVAAGSPPSSPYDGRGRRDRSSQTPVCCEITSMKGADERSCLTPPPRPPSPWPGLVPGRRSPPGSRRTDSAGRSAGAPCRPRSAPKAAPDPWR